MGPILGPKDRKSGCPRSAGRRAKSRAVIAAAHKLARLISAMRIKGEEDTERGQDDYAERYRERALGHLTLSAEKRGVNLMPGEPVTS